MDINKYSLNTWIYLIDKCLKVPFIEEYTTMGSNINRLLWSNGNPTEHYKDDRYKSNWGIGISFDYKTEEIKYIRIVKNGELLSFISFMELFESEFLSCNREIEISKLIK